jgi:hypothetical protein
MAERQHEPLPSDASSETKIAILEERIRGMRENTDKQALEYERRLTELNHAHEKQVRDQATYVSSDRYEGWQGEMNAWRADVNIKLSTAEGRSRGITVTQGFIFQILPLLIAIASIVALVYVSSSRTHP